MKKDKIPITKKELTYVADILLNKQLITKDEYDIIVLNIIKETE